MPESIKCPHCCGVIRNVFLAQPDLIADDEWWEFPTTIGHDDPLRNVLNDPVVALGAAVAWLDAIAKAYGTGVLVDVMPNTVGLIALRMSYENARGLPFGGAAPRRVKRREAVS